jgi:hypothetical protein
MKTMTEGDVREHWDETLASLATEKEVLITSGDRVVARLTVEEAEEAEKPRKPFDPEEHRRWMQEFWGDEKFDTLTPLMESREERNLVSESALAALAAQDEEELKAESNR